MFLKRLNRRKNGKAHTYWALMESVRTARGPRHRLVSYLGELEKTQQNRWARLAQEGVAASHQGALFQENPEDPSYLTVDMRSLKVRRVREFGRAWLGVHLWHLLGLESFCDSVLEPGREEIPWGIMAQILTLGRFCSPGSERAIEQVWYPQSAMEDLVGVPSAKVNTDRLYRALDQLLPHKQELEKHLKERLGHLFGVKFDVLLYDVTSTFFEGQAPKNPQALRGHSRDQRSDCKQVCLALVVTQEGLPLAYEVFDGNRADVTTVEDMVHAVENKYGRADRIWVMDRGMVSEENLEFIRQRGGHYLVGTPRQSLRRFQHHLLDQDWVQVQHGVQVKTVPAPDGQETFVLCRSQDRADKEKAIYDLFVQRLQKSLQKLKDAVALGRLKDKSRIERRVGALLHKYSRAARSFHVQLTSSDNGLSLDCSVRQDWADWARLSQGCYLLRTNLKEQDPKKLWPMYIQLTDAEAAFRTLKSDLDLRPIGHQKQDRVQAHILVCFLAFVLWKTLQQWMLRVGLGSSPRPLLQELDSLKAVDVSIHTADGNILNLACVSQPQLHLQALLAKLQLHPPERLRPPGLQVKV
jgi:transposase